MMDKIVVTAADIEKLLAWRDEHNDLVRSMPVPPARSGNPDCREWHLHQVLPL